jgi:serine phosphatase RsbU (regulator of sigma subunit)
MPVGKGERTESFTNHQLHVKAGDMLYLYTDGYADQFGGPKGKKFKYKQLNAMLLENSTKDINVQSELLVNEFDLWKGDLEQVDDVCVIGIRI